MQRKHCYRPEYLWWVLLLAVPRNWVAAAEPPPPPPVSSFAPIALLEEQIRFYVRETQDALRNQAGFDHDARESLRLNAHTLTVLALALGLHDEVSPLKGKAGGIMAASQKLANSLEDYEAAKVAAENIRLALDAPAAENNPTGWEKVAPLGALMLQVPRIEGRITRNIAPRNFARRSRNALGDTVTLAVIAQAAMADTHEVKNDADVPKWYEYCHELRESATAIGQGIRDQDIAATQAAAARMSHSCEQCHETFRVE